MVILMNSGDQMRNSWRVKKLLGSGLGGGGVAHIHPWCLPPEARPGSHGLTPTAKINEWDYFKLKSFAQQRQAAQWEMLKIIYLLRG